jgi:ferredoxin
MEKSADTSPDKVQNESKIKIQIDGHPVELSHGQSVLDGARKLGIDTPTLCYLEKCGPLNSCLVCLVKINGKLVPSCGTKATPGMVVESETNEVHEARRTALELLFSDHVGDCLAPCHRLCPLGLDIPAMLRQIKVGDLETAFETVRDALPLPAVLGRLCHHPCEQGCRRGTWDDPAAIQDLERFVADWAYGLKAEPGEEPAVGSSDLKAQSAQDAPGNPRSVKINAATHATQHDPPAPDGKPVVIVGAGPTGLAAAYQLLRDGHACTLVDRNEIAGGTLRTQVTERDLPRPILDAELAALVRLGAQFKLGVSLGTDLSVDGLLRGFDAVLLACGEISKTEGEALGLAMTPGGIKVNPATGQTERLNVFAAGRAVKPVSHLVKAMAEGAAAAKRIDQFLAGEAVTGTSRNFSSIMGRLEPGELNAFVQGARPGGSVSACDACAGFNRGEAATESSRCLHCDCRSSGNCGLQHYAQIYEVNASRYRQQRRPFEQFVQPGGVIFEPGKCISCGICVKLTELAREPLGLTFVGRGFDVKIAVPFGRDIEEGLKHTTEECVRYCPTGALSFR